MTDPAIPTTSPTTVRNANFWLYELPFALVLVLTVFGVAYTTFSRQPIKGYWEVLHSLRACTSYPGRCVCSG